MDRIGKEEKTGKPVLFDEREFKIRYISSLGNLEKYYRALEEGVIYGVKCSKCGWKYHPPTSMCNKCGSSDLEWVEIKGVGRLITYTEINVKPQTHSHYEDYIVAVADFNGFKVVGHLNSKFEDVKPDTNVSIKISRREPEDYPYIVFDPVKD